MGRGSGRAVEGAPGPFLCWVTAEAVRRPAARTLGTPFPRVHS